MILGIGVDLVEIARLERALDRWGERLSRRLFTRDECQACANRQRTAECLAARFAAKEAFFKALGTGLAHGMAWTDVEVIRGEGMAPRIQIRSKAGEIFRSKGMQRIWVSLSHQGAYSVAAVVIEG
jgi:holo-[acyl-carrier protein] synthase